MLMIAMSLMILLVLNCNIKVSENFALIQTHFWGRYPSIRCHALLWA